MCPSERGKTCDRAVPSPRLGGCELCNTVCVDDDDDDGVTCAEGGSQMEMNSLPVTRFGSLAAQIYLPLPTKSCGKTIPT